LHSKSWQADGKNAAVESRLGTLLGATSEPATVSQLLTDRTDFECFTRVPTAAVDPPFGDVDLTLIGSPT
jgi:hypothetical protein